MMNELRIQRVEFSGESMTVDFTGESCLTVALHYFPRLLAAAPEQREQWELIGRGLGVHWEALDEDVSVENILLANSRAKRAGRTPG